MDYKKNQELSFDDLTKITGGSSGNGNSKVTSSGNGNPKEASSGKTCPKCGRPLQFFSGDRESCKCGYSKF